MYLSLLNHVNDPKIVTFIRQVIQSWILLAQLFTDVIVYLLNYLFTHISGLFLKELMKDP
jgi:hypothetical protein